MSKSIISRLSFAVLAISLGLSASAENNGKGPDKSEISPDLFKKTCKAAAQQDGFSVGDFGDVSWDKGVGAWVTKMNLQGDGEKFKARCQWTGRGTPRLTVWDSGQDVMTRKYTKLDVVNACKAEALANGYEVGDFGDTEFDSASGVWVSRMMIRRPGQDKTKAYCRWDGRNSPRIE